MAETSEQQLQNYVSLCHAKKVHPNSAFTKELQISSPIRTLDLHRNYIGADLGFETILEFVVKTTTLEEIDLSGNFLTTENVKRLCEALRNHPSVHTLRLKDNRLYIESGKELVRLARFNPRIVTLEVGAGAQPASPPAAEATNPQVRKIASSTANKIPDKLLRQIDSCLAYNRQRRAAPAHSDAQ